jgi:hypothetical protein
MRHDEARCHRAQSGDVKGFVKLREQPDRAAAQEHAECGDKSARMDLRLADKNPIASVNSIKRITCRCEDRQGGTMGVQNAFRFSGRSRAEKYQRGLPFGLIDRRTGRITIEEGSELIFVASSDHDAINAIGTSVETIEEIAASGINDKASRFRHTERLHELRRGIIGADRDGNGPNAKTSEIASDEFDAVW